MPFSKTLKFANPYKTIVFLIYFEGLGLTYQVTIYETNDKNIVSKTSPEIHQKIRFLEHVGLLKTFQNMPNRRQKISDFRVFEKLV